MGSKLKYPLMTRIMLIIATIIICVNYLSNIVALFMWKNIYAFMIGITANTIFLIIIYATYKLTKKKYDEG